MSFMTEDITSCFEEIKQFLMELRLEYFEPIDKPTPTIIFKVDRTLTVEVWVYDLIGEAKGTYAFRTYPNTISKYNLSKGKLLFDLKDWFGNMRKFSLY